MTVHERAPDNQQRSERTREQRQCTFGECARRVRAWETAKIGHRRHEALPTMVSVIYTLLLRLKQLCERRLLKKRRDDQDTFLCI